MTRTEMRARNISVALMLSLVATPSLRAQSTLVDTVRQALLDCGRRLNAGDYAGALDYYADDPRFTWIEQGTIKARLHADIARGFEKLREYGSSTIRYDSTRVALLGRDAAIVTTRFNVTLGPSEKGVSFGGM